MSVQIDLSDMSVLITGAGRGLGRAFALAAARSGARVAALDIDPQLIEEVGSHPGITGHVVDVADREAFLATAKSVGRIDAVVNNAMLISYGPVTEITEEMLDRRLAIGIKGTIWGVQALLAQRDPARPASIINLASPLAERGFAGTSAYTMVKGAIASVTRTLAIELGPQNIRVNAISPGSIPTPGAVALTPREEYERRTATMPLRRLGTEEDCAAAMLWLLSDAANFVTGDTIHVDGGVTVKG
jgi:NAD(P)-dependent dehydrogenase (short-subunit alcohol dehydrogenase family)